MSQLLFVYYLDVVFHMYSWLILGDLFVYHIDAAIRGVRADFNDMRLGRSPMLGYAVAHYRQFAGRVGMYAQMYSDL